MTIPANLGKFFINGKWVAPSAAAKTMPVLNPATEDEIAVVPLGADADTEAAIVAARAAFAAWRDTDPAERIALLRRIAEAYHNRADDIAQAITLEMGAPLAFSHEAQVWSGVAHIEATVEAAEKFIWEFSRGTTRIMHEGIGVCGLITPWNWPMNQIACKVAPAIAAGCTMILKPSEIAPLSGIIFAEIMEAAGTPAGVFNLVNGDGPGVGQYLSRHPGVDMMSFTGSTRAGIMVAQSAAATVKRVAQELGGKSPNILMPDCDFQQWVTDGSAACFANSGQSCDAPTRMFVPRNRHDEALTIAAKAANETVVGDPNKAETALGPVVSAAQFNKIQGLIQAGIDEGATLAAGGTGRPQGLNRGWYVRPTVFGNVSNDMRISKEEIFGPVLAILAYDSIDHAVEMANDTVYGLGAYVCGTDMGPVRAVARRLQSGQVQINLPEWDLFAPFGGYKQSGNGREYADWGIHDFVETKAMVNYGEV